MFVVKRMKKPILSFILVSVIWVCLERCEAVSSAASVVIFS